MALLDLAGDMAMQLRGLLDGGLFMAQSALALGVAAATVLVAAVDNTRQAWLAAIVFVAASAASAWMPHSPASEALAPGMLLVLGGLLASGLRLRGVGAWIAVVLGGATAGIAGGLQTATWPEALGGLLVLFAPVLVGLVVSARVVVVPRMSRGVATARRMAGAWLAAVGILLVALLVRRGG